MARLKAKGSASPAFDALIISQAVASALISPASGASGPALTPQTFLLTFTDNLGAADISSFQVSFGGTGAQPGICSLSYSGGALGLWNNDASQLITTPPIQNNQCSIGSYTVSPAGNTLTFTVSINFLSSFQGSQEVYALGVSSSGDYHPWLDLGSWTVLSPTLTTQILSSPGTYYWTPATGVTSVEVKAWGTGGNGANAVYISPSGYMAGGGGGGGAYARKTSATVTPGQPYTIVVGAAGSATRSTFAVNVVIADYGVSGAQAIGYGGGLGGPGGQALSSVGDVVQSGGNGGNAPGSPYGGSGGAGANGGPGGYGGGASPYGYGTPGAAPGGGGGGAASGAAYTGGAGANGQVVLTIAGPSGTITGGSTYSLTTSISPSAGGTISPACPSGCSYSSGSQVTITAFPNSGYQFSGFTGVDSSNGSTGYVTMNANRSVTANFTLISTYYTLTTTVSPSGGGTLTLNPACCSYASGTQVTITATPASGYQFSSFSGVDSSSGSTGYVTMNGNRSVTANLSPISTQYTLTTTVSPAGGGTLTFSPACCSYTSGTQATITASAASNYQFSSFTGVDSSNGSTGYVTMNSNRSVTANFTVQTPTLAITSAHTGSFTQGQSGATYALAVSNPGAGPTDGTAVTVTEWVPVGLIPTGIAGSGWNCAQPAGPCTRSDVLAAGAGYPALTLTVNVAVNAPAAVTNQAAVTGGGSAPASTSDPTTVVALPVYSNPLAFAVPASVVGGAATTLTVTYASSLGASDVTSGQVQIDYCYFTWDSSGNIRLYGVNPQPDALGVLGQAATLWAGNCAINLAASSLSTPTNNPDALVLTLAVTFPEQSFLSTTTSDNPSDFVGQHEVYAWGNSAEGVDTGQVDLGAMSVAQGQDFRLDVNPSGPATVPVPMNAQLSLTVTATALNGFSGSITLSPDTLGVPPCFTLSAPSVFSPGIPATVTIQNTNCTVGQTIDLFIHGAAGTPTNGTGIRRLASGYPVIVTAVYAGDFQVSVGAPPSILTTQGSVTYPVTISSVNGQAGYVNLCVSDGAGNCLASPNGAPPGVSYSLSPTQVYLSGWNSTATANVTLYGSPNMPGGTYSLQVTGSIPSLEQHIAAFSLSTQVTTFQVTGSPSGGAITHNDGQEVQITHTVPAGNAPSYNTCTSSDPNVTCRVISSAPGAVVLGVTAQTGAAHGARMISLNNDQAMVETTIEDGAILANIQPSSIQAGGPTVIGTISGLGDSCDYDDACYPQVDVEGPGSVSVDPYGSISGGSVEVGITADSSAQTGQYDAVVDMCSAFYNAFDGLNGATAACVADAPLQVQAAQQPQPNPRILFNGTDVTLRTDLTVIVGQQINLTANPGTGALASPPWAVQGSIKGGWSVTYTNPSSATNALTTAADLTGSSATFYWVAAGANTVTLTVTDASGAKYMVFARFTVVAPTGADIGVTTLDASGILVDTEPGYLALRYGSAAQPGIVFSVNPLNYLVPQGFSGVTQWVQVTGTTNQVSRTIANSSGTQTKDCHGMLDTTYPYSPDPYTTNDAPNQQIQGGYPTYNLDQIYTMWYMFRPSLPNSLFVPLTSVTWEWKASIQTMDGQSWTFVSKSAAGQPPSQNTTTFPAWSDNVQGCPFVGSP